MEMIREHLNTWVSVQERGMDQRYIHFVVSGTVIKVLWLAEIIRGYLNREERPYVH